MLCKLKYYVEIFLILLSVLPQEFFYSSYLVLWQHREILHASLVSTCISLQDAYHLLFQYRKYSALVSHTVLLREPLLVTYLTLASVLTRQSSSFLPLTSCCLFHCVLLFSPRRPVMSAHCWYTWALIPQTLLVLSALISDLYLLGSPRNQQAMRCQHCGSS